MKEKEAQNRYSVAFKMQVVNEVENGILSAEEARKLYGIGGKQTINEWLYHYGVNKRIGKVVHVMTEKEERELLVLRRENRMLKKALEESQVKTIALETVIEVAEEEFKIEIKKKFGAKVLEDVKKKLATLDTPEESE
ncbi:MAG: transposase [Candidatus Poribacteria bacterium]|nr:transposase [Candidatus Poribacteria bacterium]